MLKRMGTHLHPHSVNNGMCLAHLNAVEQQDEFFATKPGHQIFISHLLRQQLTQLHQNLITCCMTPVVIDAFEVIDVHRHQRPRSQSAVSQHRLPSFHKSAAVEQSGERVAITLIPQIGHHISHRASQQSHREQHGKHQSHDLRKSPVTRARQLLQLIHRQKAYGQRPEQGIANADPIGPAHQTLHPVLSRLELNKCR